jgi:hypothetical protein
MYLTRKNYILNNLRLILRQKHRKNKSLRKLMNQEDIWKSALFVKVVLKKYSELFRHFSWSFAHSTNSKIHFKVNNFNNISFF